MVVASSVNVARRGIIIGSVVNSSHGLGGLSMRRNLNRSLRPPTMNTKVVGTPQMVFINPIMTIRVHRTTYIALMSSIVAGGYISIDVENPKGGY
jgi:hypothetical protein